MSLFQTDQGISTERLWGNPHAVLDPQEAWELVPTSIIACSKWCYIKRKERGKRSRGLFYTDPGSSAEPEAVYPVTLRIQGYISSCNLSPLGSWNGKPETAVKAVQTLSLVSGGRLIPWRAQQTGIYHLRQSIHNAISFGTARRVEVLPAVTAGIYLRRRVFKRVYGDPNPELNALTFLDDPDDTASRVAADWRVEEKLELGCQLLDSESAIGTSHAIFAPGDLVDVHVSVDIETNPHTGTSVHLNMLQVVQIMPAPTVTTSNDDNQNTDDPGHTRQIVRTGLIIER